MYPESFQHFNQDVQGSSLNKFHSNLLLIESKEYVLQSQLHSQTVQYSQYLN